MERLSEQCRHHIGIIVPDMDQARAELRRLYGDLPGLDFVYEFRPDTVWTEGVPIEEPVVLRICMLEWIDGKKMDCCSQFQVCTTNMPLFYSAQVAASTMWPIMCREISGVPCIFAGTGGKNFV